MVAEQLTTPLAQKRKTKTINWFSLWCLLPAVLYNGIFFIAPLLFLFWLGFWTVENYQIQPNFSLVNYIDIFSQFFSQSKYGISILQSLWVALTATILAVVISYFLALSIVFGIPERYQRLVLLLSIAPFWSSYILRLYSWQVVIANNGLINSFLESIGWENVQLQINFTQVATRIGLVHFLTPIMALILYLSLRNIDVNLIEAARNLGATKLQVFKRIIVPMSQLGIILSAGFGLIVSLGDSLSGTILGGGTGRSILGKIPLFPSVIINEYFSSTNLPKAAALATILVLIMVVVLVVSYVLTTKAQQELS